MINAIVVFAFIRLTCRHNCFFSWRYHKSNCAQLGGSNEDGWNNNCVARFSHKHLFTKYVQSYTYGAN
jgi:hypothetical protein